MLQKVDWLLSHDAERHRLAEAARAIVVGGQHTYKDRLITMLDLRSDTKPVPCPTPSP